MKKVLIIICLFLVLSSAVVTAEVPSNISEDKLKAAFIYHFISFTDWNDNLPNYYVCIPDDESLRRVTGELLQGKIINNRPIMVVNNSQFCHVLVSNEVSASPDTLTIGNLDKGAILEFRLINNKLKFAANMDNIKKTHLKISSQLLKLAILENS